MSVSKTALQACATKALAVYDSAGGAHVQVACPANAALYLFLRCGVVCLVVSLGFG